MDQPKAPEKPSRQATQPASAPFPTRSLRDSHIRLRPGRWPPAARLESLEALEFRLDVEDETAALGERLRGLDRRLRHRAEASKLDALARGAAHLRAVHQALGHVLAASEDDRFDRLFVSDSDLSDYLRGILAFAHASMRAADQLASLPHIAAEDRERFRDRAEEATNFHFHELRPSIRVMLEEIVAAAKTGAFGDAPPSATALAASLELLFEVATEADAAFRACLREEV